MLKVMNQLLLLLDFYENDGLPLRKLVSERQFDVRLSRWREAVSILQYLGVTRLPLEPRQIDGSLSEAQGTTEPIAGKPRRSKLIRNP